MAEKMDEKSHSCPSTASSTVQEERVRHSREDDEVHGEPDPNHEDVERIVPGHALDMELQSVRPNSIDQMRPTKSNRA